jgi:hypothetical protein
MEALKPIQGARATGARFTGPPPSRRWPPGALLPLLLLTATACGKVPVAGPYRQGGDGYTWCRELIEAGDSSASLATAVVWLAGIVATGVVFFGGYCAKHQAEAAESFGGVKKWFAVLSGLFASLATASATYMYGQSDAANTAASAAQKIIARVPAPTSTEYAAMDYGAWQNCQLAAAAWRDNRAKALEEAMNQLDGARKDQVAMSQAVEQANDKVRDTSSKVAELESTVAQATDAVKEARTVVAEAKAAGGGSKSVAKLADADTKLKQAESGVAAAGTVTKAAKAAAQAAVVTLDAAAIATPAPLAPGAKPSLRAMPN